MTDRLERLLNLIIALRESPRPLTAEDIAERVAGYAGRHPEAFRRMFERDKADLRALGVPVETAPVDRFREREGYRIDPRAYDLPPIELAPEELAALGVAVRAGDLESLATTGLRKLATDSAPPGAPQPAPSRTAVGLALAEPRLAALESASRERRPVRFCYRPAGRSASLRTVDPWGLVHRAGRWYLVGRDHAREGRRTFRLDRVGGDVAILGEPGSFAPREVAIDDVVADAAAGSAELAAEADVAWRVARRASGPGVAGAGSRTLYRVPLTDVTELVGWVLSLGPGVEVLGPPWLRTRVRDRLVRLVEWAAPR